MENHKTLNDRAKFLLRILQGIPGGSGNFAANVEKQGYASPKQIVVMERMYSRLLERRHIYQSRYGTRNKKRRNPDNLNYLDIDDFVDFTGSDCNGLDFL